MKHGKTTFKDYFTENALKSIKYLLIVVIISFSLIFFLDVLNLTTPSSPRTRNLFDSFVGIAGLLAFGGVGGIFTTILLFYFTNKNFKQYERMIRNE